MQIPELPSTSSSTWNAAEIPVRWDDIAQDGRCRVEALPPLLGSTAWRALMNTPAGKASIGTGIVPILTRLVIHAGDGPFGVNAPMSARGAYAFGHVLGASGQVERLLLGMWIDASLPIGRVYGDAEGAGMLAHAGAVYAEHTLTRLFAPPDERKVTRLALEGLDPVPGDSMPLVRGDDVTRLPIGAKWLEDAASVDPVAIPFGLAHTDSNQHVNSLVYVRLFEEAALRRLSALGKSTVVLARRVHIAYRKPCFAGEVATVTLRVYEHDGSLGVVGTFANANEPGRPTSHVHMILR